MQGNSSPSTSSPLIRRINRKVVRRICSGQVILDLSSAIKELVENSLDAGATSIEINLRDYGEEHFQVIDNGCGICPTNFKVLALKHHTSKLEDFTDLQSLTTFGFRGEALNSLCALGNLTVETRTKNEKVATLLTFDHSGLLISQKKTARQIGTTVTVRKLFSNLPVRSREFKRNIRKEYGKLVSLLNAYALISKGVRFVCSNTTEKTPKSVVLNTKGRGSLKDNIITVFGMNTFTSLQRVNIRISDDCKVKGFVSKPGQGSRRNVADRQYFFINGRPVDMPKVSKLVNELYKDTRSRREYPIAILDFIVPHGACDLNITPDKRIVFFSDESSVIGSLKEGLNEIYSSSKARVSSKAEIDNGSRLEKFKSNIKTRGAKKREGSLSLHDESVSVSHHLNKKATVGKRKHENISTVLSKAPVLRNQPRSFRVEKSKFEVRPLASRCQMEGDDQVDGLVVSKEEDVTPKEIDSELRNRISPETRVENLRAKRLERLSRLLSTGDVSKCKKNKPQRKKMDITTCVARRTRSRTESYLNSLLNKTKGISVEDQSQGSKKRASDDNDDVCSPPSANAAKRRRRRASDDNDDVVFMGNIFPDGKQEHARVENDTVGSASVISPRFKSKSLDGDRVYDDDNTRGEEKTCTLTPPEDDVVFLGTIPPEDDNVGSALKLPDCDKDGDFSVDDAKLRVEEKTCTLMSPSAPEISEDDKVTSLSSDEKGSVEELGTDSSDEDRDSSDSNFDEDDDRESSDYTEESTDSSYKESSESDFDEDDEDERKTPSEKVYTHGKPKTFPRKNNLNVFEMLEKSIWERSTIFEEEMSSEDETAEVDSREDAIVRESSSEKVYKERKPRSLRRVKEKKDLNVFDELGNSFFEKSCDGNGTEDSPPLNLRFGCEEEPEPIEKTEEEKELDALWAEMAFGLTSEGVRSYTPAKNGGVQCSNGTHDFVLDEEIGLKCRFCSYVSVEIKNISPAMEKYHANVNDKKTFSDRKGDDLHNKLDFEGSDQCSHGKASLNNNTQGTVWEGIPGIKDTLYPHQQEGFEFIWKNLAGTTKLEELKSSVVRESGGCVISHAPGTGKTRLTIVFLQSYLEQFPDSHPVVIAPASLLLTWEEEFKKWNASIPFYNLSSLEFSGLENQKAVSLLKGSRSDKCSVRMVKLYSWRNKKSILGVSYHLFEKLAGGGRRRQEFRKMLLELPGLLVLDEGHTPRNQKSCIWKVLSEVQTEKRIILSGTPFQNNFKELSNVLCLARPAYTDTISSRLQDLSRWNQEGKKGKISAEVGIKGFKDMIASFVHVQGRFRESLPGLRECVVVLNPTYQQKKILDRIDSSQNTFELEHKRSAVSVHPSLYLKCTPTKREKLIIGPSVVKTLEKITLDSNEGVKTRFLIDFLHFSRSLKEKVLVFSQYLDTLELIIEQIKLAFNWTEGKEILYMSGKLEQKERQHLISNFNKPESEANVLLASTKACSEGINLVGASRVVLLDVVWNPSVENQAISRAYRIGQKRVVYTYHLMVKGTSEWDKYCTQTKKHHISELVFSSSTDEKDKVIINKEVVSEDRILDEMVRHEKLKDMFEKILYHPKESDMFTNIL